MGKSIRSNSKKSLRSQRRANIETEAVYVKSAAARAAAMAKCMAAPRLPGAVAMKGDAAEERMQEDGVTSSAPAPLRRSRHRGRSASAAAAEAAEQGGGDVEMEDVQAPVTARRGPNQYRKQGRLKRGAKARLGVVHKTQKKGPTVRQHGLPRDSSRKPRFCKTSKKK